MATEVTIPNLGYTMTRAKVLQWLKSVGDNVEAGEPILEIETDKVTYAIESPTSGVVKAILAKQGDEVPVGEVVAILGGADEKIDISIYWGVADELHGVEPAQTKGIEDASLRVSRSTMGRVLASPLAKKIASEKGIDLSLIKGSGISGRIRGADVEMYLAQTETARVEKAPRSGPFEIAEIIPMTTMRCTIARRLSDSFRDVPHINLLIEVDMVEAKRLYELYKERREAQGEVKLSINDVFIKAAAVILQDHPRLNARLQGEQIEIVKNINVGLAVALDDGLIVPAIESADQKRLWQIAMERKDLVERARQSRLSLDEIQRGTFTISNLGMYGVISFTSILNPPQSGILSIGKVTDRPVVINGAIEIRPVVEITLAVDHRIVDGAEGAQFLRDLKSALENPYLLV